MARKDISLQALFAKTEMNIKEIFTITVDKMVGGVVTGEGSYISDDVVVLTAVAGSEYTFEGWNMIEGKWCYFNPVSDGTKGKMVVNTYIDGYYVGEDGVWTVSDK